MYFVYGTYKKWGPLLSLSVFHREDRWVKERSFCQALVTTLEKITYTYFGPKAFRGCCRLFNSFIHNTFIHCVDYFPCYLGCNRATLLSLPSLRPVQSGQWTGSGITRMDQWWAGGSSSTAVIVYYSITAIGVFMQCVHIQAYMWPALHKPTIHHKF